MALKSAVSKQKIVTKIVKYAQKHIDVEGKQGLIDFLKSFYNTVSADDLIGRESADLFGATFSLWQFIQRRKENECKIGVFNPDHETHGWKSTHTIIQVSYDDMPFLVDSIRMEINRLGILLHMIGHMGCFNVVRDKLGKIVKVLPYTGQATTRGVSEAVMHFEVDRQVDIKVMRDIECNLLRVVSDVTVAVEDWSYIRAKVKESVEDFSHLPETLDADKVEESRDFLNWMLDEHFTFLGCRDYKLIGKDSEQALQIVSGSGLGVLRDSSKSKFTRRLSELPEEARNMTLSDQEPLTIAKTNTIATVHRKAYTDYVGIKKFDHSGRLIGERRIVGLYTSAAYHTNPKYIPFLRHKVTHVIERSKLSPVGHSGKALLHVIETLPRDELFQASVDELYTLALGILQLQERQCVKLFIRKDSYGRFYSCFVFVPRERFSTELRGKIQDLLEESFNSEGSTFHTHLSSSVLARIHLIVRVHRDEDFEFDIQDVENKIALLARSWKDDLKNNLTDHFGEAKGSVCFNVYKSSFPEGYKEAYSPRTAVHDILYLEKLHAGSCLEMAFCQPMLVKKDRLQFKIFNPKETSSLSDVLPILENMGLCVIAERPSKLDFDNGSHVWINDFEMAHLDNKSIDVDDIKQRFKEVFSAIWFARVENDSLNRLVIEAHLSWKQVVVLRAYTKYLKQVAFPFSQEYISQACYNNPDITFKIIQLFDHRFSPAIKESARKTQSKTLTKEILHALENVSSLDEDRILRHLLSLIKATLRTNYYQLGENGLDKPYLSLKLRPKDISSLPLPLPMFEVFVYAPNMEGVHLRGAKVARGGIRWSDRREDFRTEILGLMKAQQVKNAVIVPQGAKGGFVCKQLAVDVSREETMQEVVSCYQMFIKGLLDLTDNIKEGKVVIPEHIVRYDDDDTYLVVAADKGTATFSDIANKLAQDYDFWLDDAFASGGSTGYDHKKMGITARGAWEAVKRHFREMNLNTQTTPFTVIGVGDMAGDVFGNGMLMSEHIKLLAAFNHLHIFIDPCPDVAVSFQERKRLFTGAMSGWDQYNQQLISKGGGVFSRKAKSIILSPEIKKITGLKKDAVVPSELLQALLCASVDLFWNGGIGTFVKASYESNESVGDRGNDAIRVDASSLRCQVIAEGGNLGVTQKARVEYALQGGRVNTDFIDNAGGVDCSDHEVNIKILLNSAVDAGDLTLKQRNKLLADMTDEVATLVLKNNYLQTETLSLEEYSALPTIDLFRRYLSYLEKHGKIDRALECLPTEKEVDQRKAAKKAFTRPEIAVLFTTDKIVLKEEILASELPEIPYFESMLEAAFPRVLGQRFSKEMRQHRLRREIIATQLSNFIGNAMGVNFIGRLRQETGQSVAFIVRAFMASQRLYDLEGVWKDIRDLDCQVNTDVQFAMILQLYFLIRRATRWFLKNRHEDFCIESVVKEFYKPLKKLSINLESILADNQKKRMTHKVNRYVDHGVPKSLASRVVTSDFLFHSLDVLEASRVSGVAYQDVAEAYFLLGSELELQWLREHLIKGKVDSQWDELARSSLLDELDYAQRELSLCVLQVGKKGMQLTDRLQCWMTANQGVYNRWQSFLVDARSSNQSGFVMYHVLVRELMSMAKC